MGKWSELVMLVRMLHDVMAVKGVWKLVLSLFLLHCCAVDLVVW